MKKGGMTAVILGGGISGLSSAYYLVRNGNPFKRVSYMFMLKSKYILIVLYAFEQPVNRLKKGDTRPRLHRYLSS
jgi:protoporphyrinogen oxidase